MEGYGLVAVPRKYVNDWILVAVTLLFGHTLPCKNPLRWVLFRDLTAREMMEMAEEGED